MITADVNGHVILENGDSQLNYIQSRSSRVATLDGGCVITHSGVSQGDRVFKISTKIDEYQKSLIEHIHENSNLVNVSCSDGFFIGAISSIDTSKPSISMTIMIKERIS